MQRPFSSYPNAIPTGLEASPILRSDFVGAYSAGPSTTEVQEAERKKEVHTEPLYNILCWRIFVFSLLYFVISLELDGEWTVKSRRISFGSDAKWGRSFEEFHSSFAGGRTCFTAPPLHTKERESKRETCRLRRSNGAGGPPHCEIRTEVDLPLSRRIRECSLLLSVTQNKQTRWERPKLDEFTTGGV